MSPETELGGTDWWEVARLATELAAMALTAYYLWSLAPEGWKMELRRWLRGARAPFTAAEERKAARAELWSDVLDLITYGVPGEWVARYSAD